MKDIALVIPTIRENSFNDFVSRWESIGLFDIVDLIVMEDNHTKSFKVKEGVTHYAWDDIEEDLGNDSWIIPRRSDTVRSYGYLKAAQAGYRLILTLDDDCYPPTEVDGLRYEHAQGFIGEHLKYLVNRSKWHNTLNSVKPRGIPFYNIGNSGATIVNHGLWTNVLDYDAPYQLANPVPEKFSFDNHIVPNGLYFPMCGMNVMWKAEATVLMYHLLMGQVVSNPTGPYKMITRLTTSVEGTKETREPILKKLPFDRFGDIWCGIFMKRIADSCRLNVSSGMPYIRHERASNPFTNLKKEANGLEVNEKLWEYVDCWQPTSSGNAMSGADISVRLAHLYADLGSYIGLYSEFEEHNEYFKQLGRAMVTWAKLFMVTKKSS